jgi:hypothetical protein
MVLSTGSFLFIIGELLTNNLQSQLNLSQGEEFINGILPFEFT